VREENIRLKKELEQYRKEVLINLFISLKTLSRRMPSDMVKRSHRKVIDHIGSYIFLNHVLILLFWFEGWDDSLK
jgi:hypothetical protein